jgi:sugar-specific transcriptional regulator TrmB
MMAKLGLTSCQAKVFLVLLRIGVSSAQSISKESNIARSDVYRILPTLQKIGLVEKMLAIPVMFKAISVEDTLPILFQRKAEDFERLQNELSEFLKNFEKRKRFIPAREPHFVLIPSNKAFVRRSIQLAENSTEIMETVMPIRRTKGRCLQK